MSSALSRAPLSPSAPPPGAPPFAVGDRVRCCASTRASHRLELLGLVGTVVRVKHYAGAVEGPWWGVAVAYDALPTHPPSHHEADDLAAAG